MLLPYRALPFLWVCPSLGIESRLCVAQGSVGEDCLHHSGPCVHWSSNCSLPAPWGEPRSQDLECPSVVLPLLRAKCPHIQASSFNHIWDWGLSLRPEISALMMCAVYESRKTVSGIIFGRYLASLWPSWASSSLTPKAAQVVCQM